MANNIFPNNINDAPKCTICLEKVIDNAARSVTKLICEHLFHTDCIGSEFNARGAMICPNCRVVEEEGNWMRFLNVEDDDDDEEEDTNDEDEIDEDEYYEEQLFIPEEEMELPTMIEPRHELYIDGSWTSAPPHIVLEMQKLSKFIIQQNEWIDHLTAQLPFPPPPIAPKMVHQRQISSMEPNFGLSLRSYEASTSYEQPRPLSVMELTGATSTSLFRWIQHLRKQLPLPPPPIAPKMVDQRQISSSEPNFGLSHGSHEASTSYEKARP